jgi:hypothetical protein
MPLHAAGLSVIIQKPTDILMMANRVSKLSQLQDSAAGSIALQMIFASMDVQMQHHASTILNYAMTLTL